MTATPASIVKLPEEVILIRSRITTGLWLGIHVSVVFGKKKTKTFMRRENLLFAFAQRCSVHPWFAAMRNVSHVFIVSSTKFSPSKHLLKIIVFVENAAILSVMCDQNRIDQLSQSTANFPPMFKM